MPATEAWPPLGDVERAALRVILVSGPSSRAELARTLGLSRASMTRVTRNLIDHGLIVEGGVEQRTWTGRPSELLGVRSAARHFVGIKLTGDTAYMVVTDLTATIVAEDEQPLADRDVRAVIEQLGTMYEAIAANATGIAGAGICVAGDIATIDGESLVIDSAFLGWNEVPLEGLLAERLGIPVTAENDVRALTAAEHWFGAGAGCSSFAVVTIGAGIGLGLVSGDRVVSGTTGHAGRVDHIIVDSSGPICGLGHRGCASAYLPSAAIAASLRLDVDFDAAAQLARDGDTAAIRAFEDAGRALGTIVGTVANFLDPERIVLTGDGLAVYELAEAVVHDAMAATRVPRGESIPLVVRPFEFTQWARGGAVASIRERLHVNG